MKFHVYKKPRQQAKASVMLNGKFYGGVTMCQLIYAAAWRGFKRDACHSGPVAVRSASGPVNPYPAPEDLSDPNIPEGLKRLYRPGGPFDGQPFA